MTSIFRRFAGIHLTFGLVSVGIIALVAIIAKTYIAGATYHNAVLASRRDAQAVAAQLAAQIGRLPEGADVRPYLQSLPLGRSVSEIAYIRANQRVAVTSAQRDASGGTIVAAAPVPGRRGHVEVRRALVGEAESTAAARRVALLLLPPLTLAAILCLVAVIEWTICSRLRRIRKAAAQVAAGSLPEPLTSTRRDEVADLARAFNTMVEALRTSRESQRKLIDQLREQSTRASAAERAKGHFLANMSHEIRTPINGVIGMASLLMTTRLEADQREYASAIRTSADSLLRIVNEILDFSKLEAGKVVFERTEFRPGDVIQDVALLLKAEAHAKGVALISTLHPEVPERLVGDPGRLRQVLLNLAANAVKFTNEGEVRIEVTAFTLEARTQLTVRVQDTGVGIAKEAQSTLFQPFTQADTSTTRKYGGTGLGLAICKELIELMHGTIDVESTPGAGSTFTFTALFDVPHGAPLTREPQAEPSLPQHGHGKVLVAEDNMVNQKVVLALLRKIGISAHAVSNGLDAVDACREGDFDVVLMDCQMPELDGYDAARQIREFEKSVGRKPVPIIALTAHALAGDRERCIEAGMDDYLAKPLALSQLAAALERWTYSGKR